MSNRVQIFSFKRRDFKWYEWYLKKDCPHANEPNLIEIGCVEIPMTQAVLAIFVIAIHAEVGDVGMKVLMGPDQFEQGIESYMWESLEASDPRKHQESPDDWPDPTGEELWWMISTRDSRLLRVRC